MERTSFGGRRRAARPATASVCAQVRDVVMVVSSSRGGSSYLMELLARAPALALLQGESTPVLRLAGLDAAGSGQGSDALDGTACDDATVAAIDRELAREIGVRTTRLDGVDQFVDRILRRLAQQWPGEPFVRDEVARDVQDALAELGWRAGALVDPQRFTAVLLRRLRARTPRIDPHYYDLPRDLVAAAVPGLARPVGPPAERLVEEPPFVCFAPWRELLPDELAQRPLVIKSPSNAYRLPFFRRLFPNARFRILHLTRNPAASINGLVDGWLHHGFHALRVREPLAIAGYSDVRPADAHWWKFDLPPGWQDMTRRSLPEVCAFQWRAAHEAVLAFVAAHPVPYLRMRFEDLVGAPAARDRVLRVLAGWLGVDCGAALVAAAAAGVPAVMGTRTPGVRRWTTRAAALRSVLADPALRAMAHTLGYDDESQWI